MTQEQLKELLDYDPVTGVFVYKTKTSRYSPYKPWSVAGSRHDGYLRINLHKKRYMLHNLAWLYIYGRWPHPKIDHINGVRDDNRISNLREATNSQNGCNKRGFGKWLKGAYPRDRAWMSEIMLNRKRIYLGYFKTEQEAHDAYCVAAKHYFGEYAKT